MTRQQVAVIIIVVLLLTILATLAIVDARSSRGKDDDPRWKDDYTGWGG